MTSKELSRPAARRSRGRPALGRSAPLSRQEILDTAMKILREHGKDALSMRRLATDLGVTPMAIYHHVEDKPALIYALVGRVWAQMGTMVDPQEDPIEFLVQACSTTRRVWLENFELASLAVAVAELDEFFFDSNGVMALVLQAGGFPDVPLAFSAVQNYTMGCVQIIANRRVASAYFGRDPADVRRRALAEVDRRGATSDHRGVIEARFDEADEAHFEPSLRALIAGLLATES